MSLRDRFGLKDDERLLAVVRAAPITILAPGLLALALLAAPFFLLMPLLKWETLGIIILSTLFALGLFFGIRLAVRWRCTVFIVTERRLIVIRQNGYFDRHATELPFAKVHDVSYRVKGVFPTVFRYGTVIIESAGSDEPLEFERVARPAVLQGLLVELQERSEKGRGDFGEMLQAVADMETRELLLLQEEIKRSLKRRPDIG